jgi:preprotein translocase subunit SecD/SecD/SecF fusion protein
MLYFARWKTALIILVVLAGIVMTLPNFFSKEEVDSWPSWLPKKQLVLGLDLQGGAYLLYEVDRADYIDKRLRTLVSDVRKTLTTAPRVGYTGLGVQGETVQLRIRDLNMLDDVRKRLEPLRNQLASSLLGGSGVNEFDLTVADDGLTRFAYSAAGLSQKVRGIVAQSIEVINRRIDQLGTTEPSIQRQGDDRILVEAPGLGDPARLKAIVGQTAQLAFHLVTGSFSAAQPQVPGPGIIAVPSKDGTGTTYLVQDTPLMTGEDLVDAQPGFDSRTNEAVVNFRLSTSGARRFGDVTSKNVGRPFAIILDNQVISAPVIREPIIGGSGQISGSFTVQTANDLSILLRAGSLPAKLTIVEERTIGPSLGRDSIRAGVIATAVATIGIVTFMVICYGILGFFADIALVGNNFLMLGILTALGATLTLPGIAGIILTMGMAVDANVLIYERMREEQRAGRSTISALDNGFRRAFATIIDSHLTALIAAIALFWLGSGPIRGFAVTLAIGIISTLFTAYLVTRLIVSIWVRVARPKTIPL